MANGQIEPISDEQSQLQLAREIVKGGVTWFLPGLSAKSAALSHAPIPAIWRGNEIR
jgi:hypothetical protein